VEPEIPPLPFDLPVRRNLFLAVKEILNNAAKHSGATELFLRIHRRGAEVFVRVEDNGKGFDPTLVDPERNGLSNLKQRMDEIGGTCTVNSQLGAGCLVTLSVSLARSRPRLARWFESGQRLSAAI
jgi:signal transduction histidine kinase